MNRYKQLLLCVSVLLVSTHFLQADSPLMQEIKALVTDGYDVNKLDENGELLLHKASFMPDIDAINFLLEVGANVHIKDSKEYNALQYALLWGEVLSEIRMPLSSELYQKNVQVVKRLLEAGADVQSVGGEYNRSLLINAARTQLIDVVKILLDYGATVNYKDTPGFSALHYATMSGNREIVEILLNRGADVNLKACHDMTALFLAVGSNLKEICTLLIKSGADVNEIIGNASLVEFAVDKGHEDILELLLQYNAVVNHQNNSEFSTIRGGTALHSAVCKKNKAMVKMLLEAGADVTLKTVQEYTAFHFAVESGQEEVCRMLLDAGTDVDYHIAAYSLEGVSSLQVATLFNRSNIVKMLLEHKVPVDYQCQNGWTALHTAAKYGSVESARLLLATGADISLKDNHGFTAAEVAAQAGHAKLAYMLSPTFLVGSLRYIKAKVTPLKKVKI